MYSPNPLAKASFDCRQSHGKGIRNALLRRLPEPAGRHLKVCVRLCLDGVDLLLGRRKELVPPRYLNFGGDGDFERTGEEFLRYFRDLGGLRPIHRVLDVGCGIGRMARPLTKYLSTGSYEGIDIVPRGIRWCQRAFRQRYPNFNFQLADVRNREYNPTGRYLPIEYCFPFLDEEFDFVFLTSVFTHMQMRDMKHYLGEVGRTLRRGGKCLITLFLLNDNSRSLMEVGLSSINFRFPQNGCWTADELLPENALAFDESDIVAMYKESRLDIENVHYGAWCGRKEYLSYQDIVVARKI